MVKKSKVEKKDFCDLWIGAIKKMGEDMRKEKKEKIKVVSDLDIVMAWVNNHSESAEMNAYAYDDFRSDGLTTREAVAVYDLENFVSELQRDPEAVRERAKVEGWYPHD